jgi:hypothetical protein
VEEQPARGRPGRRPGGERTPAVLAHDEDRDGGGGGADPAQVAVEERQLQLVHRAPGLGTKVDRADLPAPGHVQPGADDQVVRGATERRARLEVL